MSSSRMLVRLPPNQCSLAAFAIDCRQELPYVHNCAICSCTQRGTTSGPEVIYFRGVSFYWVSAGALTVFRQVRPAAAMPPGTPLVS